jgi:hypothetical protein
VNGMIASLCGDYRLLNTGQQLLRLRQRQPQIGDISEAGRPIDLDPVNTSATRCRARFRPIAKPTP